MPFECGRHPPKFFKGIVSLNSVTPICTVYYYLISILSHSFEPPECVSYSKTQPLNHYAPFSSQDGKASILGTFGSISHLS